MLDYGTVLETMERDVYHATSGLVLKTLMVATIYRLPHPVLVLTREILTPNVTDVTVSYMRILGDTLEGWKRSLEEQNLTVWNPLRDLESGLDLS